MSTLSRFAPSQLLPFFQAHCTLATLCGLGAMGCGILVTSCASTSSGDALPPPRMPYANTSGAPAPQGPTDAFRPGDSLELYVKEDSTFSGSYVVRQGGYILIPKVGRITVQGLTKADAEQAIRRTLQNGQLTVATVMVERNPGLPAGNSFAASGPVPEGGSRIMVYLTGKVAQPGPHFVPVKGRSLGLFEALLITNSIGKFANMDKVEILRMDESGRRRHFTVDVSKIRDGKADDVPLGEGDIINVPEKTFGF